MKKLKTTDITESVSMPLKSGTLDFIQEAYQETNVALMTQLLGYTPDVTKGYIISGVKVTIAGSLYTITDGYIFFNNEIFKVNGGTINLAAGQQVWATIINVPYTNADPVTFSDNIQRNVHLNRQMQFTSAVTGDLLLSNIIKSGVWLTGDLKEIDCTNAYMTANFDSTGLGINERIGWAICNGNNGTKNRNGRVSVAYGTSYTALGTIAGEASHTLTINEIPSHTHDVIASNQKVGTGNPNGFGNSGVGATLTTESTGGGMPHNNMQPYIITLIIQKL